MHNGAMGTPRLTIRSGHPDFLDLPWDEPLAGWEHPRLADLPKGISRHEVRFVVYEQRIYAVKELPVRPARHEYQVLRRLEDLEAPAVRPVGVVERVWVDPHEEQAAAVITRYLDYSFSYLELLSGPGFGPRRNQMLDGLAWLLVQLHLLGCYWGDCSLSNVLYRFDAEALEVTMVDAETAQVHEQLSDGQRREDIEVMIVNVAGGMADIAASTGSEIDHADLALGEDIAARYEALWAEVTTDLVIGKAESYRIAERIERLNDLGLQVEDLELVPEEDGNVMRMTLAVAGRTFHRNRLWELTGVEASENQARQILSDLRYSEARRGVTSPAGKAVAAMRWRVAVFEPMMQRIADLPPRTADPVQAYCDFLNHRYQLSAEAGHDISHDDAFGDWVAQGQPGYRIG
jgi:hypothetical protein